MENISDMLKQVADYISGLQEDYQYQRDKNTELRETIATLQAENKGLRANAMIQEHIITSNGNPLDKDKIIRLIMEKTTLQAENAQMRQELEAALGFIVELREDDSGDWGDIMFKIDEWIGRCGLTEKEGQG